MASTPLPQRIGIIGAGMLGLSLAYRLRQRGHGVTIFEASGSIGGQAGVWQLGDLTWDRHYHIITQQDKHLLQLLEELELTPQLVWARTRTGFFAGGRLHSMSNSVDFLKFPILSLIDKMRLAITILRASTIRNLSAYESSTSVEWLYRWSGKATTETLWQPLLQSKFGEQYRQLSAAFIISTIKRMYGARQGESKQELFGYVRGGYNTILNRLRQRLDAMQVAIHLSSPISSVTSQGGKVKVERSGREAQLFDRVIITAAASLVPRLCPQLPEEEKALYSNLPYLGIVCASVLLEQPISGYYITNVVDRAVPFTGIIEMSALVDKREFGGLSLVYLPKYIGSGDSFFDTPDEELQSHYIATLEKMYPHFQRSHVRAFKISRVKYVMAIPTAGVLKQKLPVRTSLEGIYTVNTGHITDGVLTVDKMIGAGAAALDALG